METHIVIENTVYQKIMHWINKSEYEVSGLGKIIYSKGRIQVIEAMLLPQKNGSTHTDIEGADVGKAMFLLKDSPGDLRWWWHSHVDMPVFWSGTDKDTIDKISQGGWFVSTVFNKRNEMRSCLNMVSPLPLGMMDDIPTRPIQFIDDKLIKAWDEDYEKNVTNLTRNYHFPKPLGHYSSWDESRFNDDGRSTREGGQLDLPGSDLSSDDGPMSRIPKPMSEEEIGEYLERRRKAVPRSGPPTGPNGTTGGW